MMDWDQLYRQHQGLVFGHLYNRTSGNADLARDLTQDVFVRAMRSERQFRYDDGRGVGPWLVTIASNLLRDHFRSARVRYEVELFDWCDGDQALPSAEDQVLNRVDTVGVLTAVAGLLPDQREALLLQYWGRWTDEQISARLHRNVGAVKTLKHRARANLRRHLAAVA